MSICLVVCFYTLPDPFFFQGKGRKGERKGERKGGKEEGKERGREERRKEKRICCASSQVQST